MNSYIQNSIIANLTNGKLAESIANALGDKKLKEKIGTSIVSFSLRKMKRINFDYEKMNIPELKKLLNERNLKKDGSKSEMIERLVVYSRTNKYLNCPLCGVFHKFIWDGPYDKNTYSCLSCKTLYKNIKI